MKNLTKKILAVMADVTHVAKDAVNEFHNYEYVSNAAIVTAVREAMIKHKLVLISSHVKCDTMAHTNKKGDPFFLTKIEIRYQLIDTESSEIIEAHAFGCGQDAGDKGLYKAITGAEKYYLLKTFLIPTHDDPEATDRAPAIEKAQKNVDEFYVPGDVKKRLKKQTSTGGKPTSGKSGGKSWYQRVCPDCNKEFNTSYKQARTCWDCKQQNDAASFVKDVKDGKNTPLPAPTFDAPPPPTDDDVPDDMKDLPF